MPARPLCPSPWTHALVLGSGVLSTATLASVASAGSPAASSVEIVSRDGRTWDAILQEIETDPSTLGHVYLLAVHAQGASVACADYELSLDTIATHAFVIDGCDISTGETRLRVVDRPALFSEGDVVPRPRNVSVHAVVHQSATAWGGGVAPATGSKIGCSVWLQPYAWDGLHGVTVPLPPDRFELVPLDESIHASPDGSGWIARGESHMDVSFHYEVRDRATGAKVVENVARLSCADAPSAAMPAAPETAIPEIPPWAYASTPSLRAADTSPYAPAQPVSSPDDRAGRPLAIDLRMIVTGWVVGASAAQMELTGFVLGAGHYVSDRWYVGGSARWALALDMGDDTSGVTNVLQLGPEVRYAFHLGTGSLRTKGGPARRIPSADWLGLRAGLEDVGPSVMGAFTEVAWGSEFRIRSIDVGTVLAAGAGYDARGAYGDSSVVHPYVDFAFRFGLNL